MTRLQWLLLIIIGAEIILGSWWIYKKARAGTPPLPNLSLTDSATAADLRDLSQTCHSVKDWVALADAYMSTGFFSEAETCYRVAVELQPKDLEHRFLWAFALSRIGHTKQSNKQFHVLIDQGYDDTYACWFFIGRNHLRQERANEAAAAFQKVTEFAPAQLELARLHVRHGDNKKALALVDKVLAHKGHEIEANWLRYRIESNLGHVKQADYYRDRTEWATARQLTPFAQQYLRLKDVRNQFGLNRLSALAERQSRPREAARLLKDMLQIQWDANFAAALANLEMQLDGPEAALPRFQRIVNKTGATTRNLWRLGHVLEKSQQPAKAVQQWKRAAALHTVEDLTDLYFGLYKKLDSFGNKKSAQHYHVKYHFALGKRLFWKQDWPRALEQFQKAVEKQSDLAHAWYYLGETHRRMGDIKAARTAYERCLTENPQHGRVQAALQRFIPGLAPSKRLKK